MRLPHACRARQGTGMLQVCTQPDPFLALRSPRWVRDAGCPSAPELRLDGLRGGEIRSSSLSAVCTGVAAWLGELPGRRASSFWGRERKRVVLGRAGTMGSQL